jgi:hypothetical protein
MFDIQTKRLIIINGIELNLFGNFDYAVEIYTKIGSFKDSRVKRKHGIRGMKGLYIALE